MTCVRRRGGDRKQMPAPTNERQAFERERDELPAHVANCRRELDATPRENKERRERLAWQIRRVEKTAKKFRLRSCSSYVLSSHVARCSPASTCQNDGAALACFLPPTRWEALIVAATPDSTGGHDGSDSTTSAPPAALLAQLNRSTDLAWLVERVCRNNLPWVVVPGSALTAWQQRDPAGWEKVSAWLGAKGITIVRI